MPGGDGGASAASAAGGGGRDPYFTAVAPNPGAQNTNAGVPGADWFAMVPQMCLMMAMYYTFMKPPPPRADQGAAAAAGGIQGNVQGAAIGGASAVGGPRMPQGPTGPVYNGVPPLWPLGTEFEVYVYLTGSNETSHGVSVSSGSGAAKAAAPGSVSLPEALSVGRKGPLVLHESGLKLDSSLNNNERFREMNLTRSDVPHAWDNRTVFLHVFAVRNGKDPLAALGTKDVAHGVRPLVFFEKRQKAKKTKNLISGELSDKDKEILEKNAKLNVTEEREDEYIPVWKSELYIDLVEETSTFPRGGIPPPMADNMRFIEEHGMRSYLPILHLNEFWLTRKDTVLVNETVDELPLKLHVRCSGRFKWLTVIQWEASMKQQQSMGTQSDKDQDLIKTVLLDTNPLLLAVTMTVSMLHTIFDFLAFKNDISFWRKVETMQGLSIRSIFTSIITQTIIFLYLCDNDTSWMILFSSGIGLVIECWKVKKAMDFERTEAFPYIRLKHKQSYKSETLKYDKLAMNYLSYVLYPLAFGFSIYSLFYNTYKSWWSWLISSLVGCVYTFGFIMMTPQLFINYKLKSVAHLPWRAMVYKFLNTIIDDLFAFVIKMPTLHKLSVFRDDLIFLIYLYQRWAYRVDRKRVNEYGLVAKDMDDLDDDKRGKGSETKAVQGDNGKPAESGESGKDSEIPGEDEPASPGHAGHAH